MPTMVEKRSQPKPPPQQPSEPTPAPAQTGESARSALQQSMDRRW